MIRLDEDGISHNVSSMGFDGQSWVKATCGEASALTGLEVGFVTCLACARSEWFMWPATMTFSIGVDHGSEET